MLHTEIDWDQARFAYEILGMSRDEVCSQFSITPGQLEYAINEQSWKLPVVCETEDNYLDTLAEKALAVRSKKDSHLTSRYATLELAILNKVQSLISANGLTPKDLKTLTDIIVALRADTPNSGKDSKSQGKLTINILNHIGQEDATQAIEIEQIMPEVVA